MTTEHVCVPAEIVRDMARIPGYVCRTCGRLLKASPSAVKTFRLCPRRWAFEYIRGVREPGSAATEFGGQVHDWLEAALKGAQPPAVREIAAEAGALGLAEFRRLGLQPLEVETEMALDVEGVSFRGRIDVYAEMPDGRRGVVDWKTCAAARNALTSAQVAEDYQLGAYAHWLQTQGKRVDFVGHVQIIKNGCEWGRGTPEAASAFAPAPPFDVEPVAAALREMDALARAVHAAGTLTAAPQTLESCWAFRRLCHHDGPCKGPEESRSLKMSDFLTRLKAARAAQRAPEAEPTPAPEVVEAAEDAAPWAFLPPDSEPDAEPTPWAGRDVEAVTEVPGVGPGVVSALRAAGVRTVGEALAADLGAIKGVGPKKAAAILEWIRDVPAQHPNPRLRVTDARAEAAAVLRAALDSGAGVEDAARRALEILEAR